MASVTVSPDDHRILVGIAEAQRRDVDAPANSLRQGRERRAEFGQHRGPLGVIGDELVVGTREHQFGVGTICHAVHEALHDAQMVF